MYKNIERKQRLIEVGNETNLDTSEIDEGDTENDENATKSKSKIGLINQKIFNSQFMDSLLKTNRKYDKMKMEDILDSFVGQSLSHNEASSFLNESNYSIFSKSAAKTATPM